MKPPTQSSHAFTHGELIVGTAAVVVLGSLLYPLLRTIRCGCPRDVGEIAAISAACENYRGDNGSYPFNEHTDALDPRVHGDPASAHTTLYRAASKHLYRALSGDLQPEHAPDGQPDSKAYFEFSTKRDMLAVTEESTGQITRVHHIRDPWGNPYGYSTAAAKEERLRDQAIQAGNTPPTSAPRGYNPTFDFWSTRGTTTIRKQKKWTKNWLDPKP